MRHAHDTIAGVAKYDNIVLLGAGQMAEALISGLVSSGARSAAQIRAVDLRAERLAELAERHGIATSLDVTAVLSWAEVIILATKPQALPALLASIGPALRHDPLLVSIAAGTTLAALESALPTGTRVVRTMPNTPALVRAGVTAIAAGQHATAEDITAVRQLFDCVGYAFEAPESWLDAVTGLSGSGPAYVFLVIEALADGGVAAGLPRELAQRLAAETVLGSAKLLLESGQHPAALKDMVTSPAGTTIAGLAVLEEAGARAAFLSAVLAASERSRALGAGK